MASSLSFYGTDASASEPLVPRAGMASIRMKESVYSFMLFAAPVARRRTGHYYTHEVLLAVMLLVLNISLQLGLTLIAGGYIVQRATDFKQTLVFTNEHTTPWAQVYDETRVAVGDNVEYVDRLKDKHFGKEDTKVASARTCCDGAECAALVMPCCNRRGAKPHKAMEPMQKNLSDIEDPSQTTEGFDKLNFLSFQKPSKKKKEEQMSQGGAQESFEEEVPSLCKLQGQRPNQTIVCHPLSYEFFGAWKYLDTNGDGIWTLEEARADEANLGCLLGVCVEEVFRSTCRGVQIDNEDTSETPPYHEHEIPISIQERRAIPKVYFDWWRGLSLICVVHDVARCGELVSRGIFDGVIGVDDHFARGGVQDLDTALDYCQRLLRAGGICEKTLPGSYMTYRSRVAEKCGIPHYSTGHPYVNPVDHADLMQTTTVSYGLVDQYRTSSTIQFKFFLGLILFLWYIHLVGELKDISVTADFLLCFPVNEAFPLLTPYMRNRLKHFISFSDEEVIDPNSNRIIHEISPPHKVTCATMLVVRCFILLYMFNVGTNYLITNHNYDDLLLNAVALAFIFDLPKALYVFLVSEKLQDELSGARTAGYASKLPSKASMLSIIYSKALWGLFIIPALAISVVIFNDRVTTVPSLKALQCACFQEGDQCDVASLLTREWWNQYWQEMAIVFKKNYVPK